jgi:CheY-like chemotaxis protein
MSAKEFHLGFLLVDDDPDIVEQHRYLLENRAFRKQTPGKLYTMLRDAGLVKPDEKVEATIGAGRWPSKGELEAVLVINPEIESPYRIVEPDVAESASEADKIWNELKDNYLSEAVLGCYIALLDHDMPVKTGLELAEEWRPLIGGVGPGRLADGSPIVVFYTGRGPLLSETLAEEGYRASLDEISTTGLAEAVLQKGVLRDEFNQLIWGLMDERIRVLVGRRVTE